MHLTVRPLSLADIDGVLAIQARTYPGFLLESRGFYVNRLDLAPSHCWVASGDDKLLGYLIAYPWTAELPPTLDVPLTELPKNADHWFLHDCAVTPQAQGLGIARQLLQAGINGAVNSALWRASLVSLPSATAFWQSQGYVPVDWQSPALAEKLAGYGPQACYMTRSLSTQRFP